MIRNILVKDLKLLWPLAAVVAALQVTMSLLLASSGPLQRWSGGRGSDLDWMSNGLLPVVCLIGLAILVLGVIHQDRFPGTTQDWLIRPITRRALVLAKLAFIGVAGLLPIFLCDVATGVGAGLPLAAVIGASAGRALLLLVLCVLPATLIGVVTRRMSDALVVCVLILVMFGIEVLVLGQLRPRTPVMGSSYEWVADAVLVCVIALVVPLLVALQFAWRSTRRVRWIAVATIALLPAATFIPWRLATFAQRLVSHSTDTALPTLSLDRALPSRLEWPTDEQRREDGAKAEAFLDVPLTVALASPTDVWKIDYQTFRVLTPAGKTIYALDYPVSRRYASGLLTEEMLENRTSGRTFIYLPVAVAAGAVAKHAVIEATLGVSVFSRSFVGSLRALDGSALDAASRCRRVVNGEVTGLQCTSTHPIYPCTFVARGGTPDFQESADAGNCRPYTYGPFPISFWRDAFYTAELLDPPKLADSSAKRSRTKVDDSVVNFMPRAHGEFNLTMRLDDFVQSMKAEETLSRDGKGAEARLASPAALVSDRRGTLYFVDRTENVLRRIAPSGEVTTLAGVAGKCGRADGHGAQARFCRPTGLTIDDAGYLYVLDAENGLIRKVSPAGDVTTSAVLTDPNVVMHSTELLGRVHELTRGPDGSLYAIIEAPKGKTVVIRIAADGTVTTIAGPDPH